MSAPLLRHASQGSWPAFARHLSLGQLGKQRVRVAGHPLLAVACKLQGWPRAGPPGDPAAAAAPPENSATASPREQLGLMAKW
eukprot:6864356-Pyramimonas_sp.AAC.1